MKLKNEILRLAFFFVLSAVQEIAGTARNYTEDVYRDKDDNKTTKEETKDQ